MCCVSVLESLNKNKCFQPGEGDANDDEFSGEASSYMDTSVTQEKVYTQQPPQFS